MQTAIASLGPCRFDSPLTRGNQEMAHFRNDGERVLWDDSLAAFNQALLSGEPPLSLELAGARERIFFDPNRTRAAIVTCGGLCPGLNDVIRGLVMELHHRYNVRNIIGFRYGYEGMIPAYGHVPIRL